MIPAPNDQPHSPKEEDDNNNNPKETTTTSMKRRLPKFSNQDALLPVTNADVVAEQRSSGRLRRPPNANKEGPSGLNLCGFFTCLSLVVGFIVFIIVTQSYHTQLEHHLRDHPIHKKLHSKIKNLHETVMGGSKRTKPDNNAVAPKPQQYPRREQERPSEDLPLHPFASLRYPLLNSKVVLLYFAASWCPMSTPVTHQLDALFRPLLLPPLPLTNNNNDKTPRRLQRHGASLVFVSSDRNAHELDAYQQENWMAVPFDSPDRPRLKQHFRTCAKVELEGLGMDDRDREIPALIIVSGETHEVVSYNGVQDLHEREEGAMGYWTELVEEAVVKKEKEEEKREVKDEE